MGGKKQTVTQTSQPWAPAQPYLKDALSQAQSLYRSGAFAPAPYGLGSARDQQRAQEAARLRVPELSQVTRDAMGNIVNMANAGSPAIDTARQTLMGMMGNDNMYRGMDAVRSNILGSAIPAAASMFSGSGMTNSSTAMEGVGRSAIEALAPFEYGAYENAMGRQLQAAGMVPGMETAAYMPAQMALGMGQLQDQFNQNRADAAAGVFDQNAQRQAQNFNNYLAAVMGLGGMGSTGTQTGRVPGTGLGAGIMGGLSTYGTLAGLTNAAGAPLLSSGLAAGGGILAGLAGLSDRRAKEDISKIGKLDNGTNIYRFRYKGHPKWHIGVMADEVPHAVMGQVNGYDVVDYGRV